jgi:hypothetical protein
MTSIIEVLIVYSLGFANAIIFVFIMFLLAGKNARIFFFNELFRKPTVFNIVGRKLRVFSAEISNNLAKTKIGDFIINPKSTYYSNNMVFFTYSNLGANLDLKHVKATEKLSEAGIKDYEQAEKINNLLKTEGKTLVTEIDTKEAISFDEIENFFKYNINADYIRSAIEHEVSSRLRTTIADVFKWVALIAGIGGLVFIGYIIIQDNNKVPISVCQQIAKNSINPFLANKQVLVNTTNQTAQVITMR